MKMGRMEQQFTLTILVALLLEKVSPTSCFLLYIVTLSEYVARFNDNMVACQQHQSSKCWIFALTVYYIIGFMVFETTWHYSLV